jgi:hypothetical protein
LFFLSRIQKGTVAKGTMAKNTPKSLSENLPTSGLMPTHQRPLHHSLEKVNPVHGTRNADKDLPAMNQLPLL